LCFFVWKMSAKIFLCNLERCKGNIEKYDFIGKICNRSSDDT